MYIFYFAHGLKSRDLMFGQSGLIEASIHKSINYAFFVVQQMPPTRAGSEGLRTICPGAPEPSCMTFYFSRLVLTESLFDFVQAFGPFVFLTAVSVIPRQLCRNVQVNTLSF